MLDVADNEILCTFIAHAVHEQDFEVLPLYGARILELVYHDMLQSGANLFKDKWRIAVLNHAIEQMLRVAQQKSVGVTVHLTNGLLDILQQP